MKIEFDKKFKKQYLKLKANQKNRIDEMLRIFKKDPYSKILRTTALREK